LQSVVPGLALQLAPLLTDIKRPNANRDLAPHTNSRLVGLCNKRRIIMTTRRGIQNFIIKLSVV